MTLRWQRLLSIVLSVAILFSFLSWNNMVLAEGTVSSDPAQCLGHSLSLDGKIGINFYYRFSEELLNNESAVVRFTYADSHTETINLRAGDPQSGGVYIYSAYVAAKEMADVVTAEVIANGQVIDTTTYSANQYYAELMNNATYRNNGALKTIVVYMLLYGNAAQNYFEYNLGNLAIDSEHLPEVEFNLSSEDIDDYLSSYDSYNVALGDDYIHFAGSDLTIASTTTMGLYFEVTSMNYSYEDIRVSVDGEERGQGDGNSLVEIDGKWYLYVTVSDIDARNISSTHNVKIYLFGNENPSVDVNYSPLAYCRLVRKNNDCSEELRELALRFTEYSIAVDGYLDYVDSSPVPTNTPTPTAMPSTGTWTDSSGDVFSYLINSNANTIELSLETDNGDGRVTCVNSINGYRVLLFNCSNMNLTSIDVSGCSNLNVLYCDNNQLTSIDVSGCSNLYVLYCDNNQLTSLNISSNVGLKQLYCSGNSITNLDISANEYLVQAFFDGICDRINSDYYEYKKDSSRYTAILRIDCTTQIINNGTPTPTPTSIPSSGTWTDNYGDVFTYEISSIYGGVAVTLSQDNGDGSVICPTYCYGVQVTEFYCNNWNLTSLYVGYNTKLKVLCCNYNSLTSLDLSNNRYLEQLECKNNNFTSLDISNHPYIVCAYSPYNDLGGGVYYYSDGESLYFLAVDENVTVITG